MAAHIDLLTASFPVTDHICINTLQLQHTIPLDNHLNILLPSSPPAQHDRLSNLPTEVLHEIWAHLDIETLTHFRRVSRHLRNTVTSQKEYAAIARHAPLILRATLATHAGQLATTRHAYNLVFHDAGCAGRRGCTNLGLLLHLPTYTRTCYDCLRCEENFVTVRVQDLKRHFLMDFKGMPVLESVPGAYGSYGTKAAREQIISLPLLNTLRQAQGDHVMRIEWLKQLECTSLPADTEAMLLAVRLPHADLATGAEKHVPRVCRGCFKVDPFRKGLQTVATVSAETFDLHAATCQGTVDRLRRLETGRRLDDSYFEENFFAKFGKL